MRIPLIGLDKARHLTESSNVRAITPEPRSAAARREEDKAGVIDQWV